MPDSTRPALPQPCVPTAPANRPRVPPWRPEQRPQITSPEAAADLLVPLLQDLDREHAETLNLDTRHRLVATTTVSIGSVDHTFMSTREVFRDALHHGAGAIVIAVTTPPDAEPSRRASHPRLGQAGEIT